MRLHARANPSTETDGRLSATLIAWGEVGRPHDDTGRTFDVVVEPGGLMASEVGRVLAFDGHRIDGPGDIIGEVLASDIDDVGYHVDVDLWSLVAADRVRELGRHLPLSVSAEFTGDNAPGDDGVIRFTAANPATLTGVAVLDPLAAGAFPSARVTKVASRKEPEMETETTEVEATATADGNELDLVADLRGEIAAVERRVLAAQVGGRTATRHPLAEFTSFEDLMTAARTTRDDKAALELSAHFTAGYRNHSQRMRIVRQFGAALVDQVTGDNPGLVHPHYLTEVYGLIDQDRPVITGLGGPSSIGASGMSVTWPTTANDLTAIVAEQLTEKAPVNSIRISFGEASEPIRTWAAASDISFQLAERSQPPYIQLHNRVLQSAYNVTTDTVMAEKLVDDATGYVAWTPATATGEDSAKAAINASVKVQKATGSPATVIIAGENAFTSMAIAFWSHAPAYGTQNTGGTSQASTLAVNVSGLPVVYAPTLDTNTAVVTNGKAASFGESGPSLVTATDVERLGTDVALWGLGAPMVFTPAGVVVLAATAPVTASASKKK